MRLDQATIPIEPRPTGACIDLAAQFLRRNALGLAQLLAIFAVPGLLLATVSWTTSGGVFFRGVVLFGLLSPLFEAALVDATGRASFGEPFAILPALRGMGLRLGALALVRLASLLVVFAGFMFFIIPGFILMPLMIFLTEIVYLERVPIRDVAARLTNLTSQKWGPLLYQGLVMTLFHAGLFASVFLLVDVLSWALLGYPLLAGRLTRPDPLLTLALINTSTACGLVMLAVFWVTSVLVRIAWFFVYLDLRIEKECWDLELDLRVEAARLEAARLEPARFAPARHAALLVGFSVCLSLWAPSLMAQPAQRVPESMASSVGVESAGMVPEVADSGRTDRQNVVPADSDEEEEQDWEEDENLDVVPDSLVFAIPAYSALADSTRVRAELRRVLQASEFGYLKQTGLNIKSMTIPGWLGRLLEKLFDRRGARPQGSARTVRTLLVILLLLAIVLGALKWLAWQPAFSAPRHRASDLKTGLAVATSATTPGEWPPEAYLKLAREAAACDDSAAVVKFLLLGGMSWVERRGLIRYRRGLTNHDYVKSLRGEEGPRAALQVLVRVFEPVHFGRRAARPDQLLQCFTAFTETFLEPETDVSLSK